MFCHAPDDSRLGAGNGAAIGGQSGPAGGGSDHRRDSWHQHSQTAHVEVEGAEKVPTAWSETPNPPLVQIVMIIRLEIRGQVEGEGCSMSAKVLPQFCFIKLNVPYYIVGANKVCIGMYRTICIPP